MTMTGVTTTPIGLAQIGNPVGRTQNFTIGGYTFHDQEIEQVRELVIAYWAGAYTDAPLSARRFTPTVLEHALRYGLLEKRATDRRYHTPHTTYSNARVRICDIVPPEVVWRLLAPMIPEETGYIGKSICYDRRWETGFGLYWAGRRWFSRYDEDEMMYTLAYLDQAGYLWFRAAGTVWAIEVRDGVVRPPE